MCLTYFEDNLVYFTFLSKMAFPFLFLRSILFRNSYTWTGKPQHIYLVKIPSKVVSLFNVILSYSLTPSGIRYMPFE